MMKRAILSGLILLFAICQLMAQEQLSLKQRADQLYDRFEYFKSLDYYLKLADKNKPDVKLLERVADCYKNINHYTEAEEWYAKAAEDSKADKITHYNYAEVLLRNQKFELAKQQYQLYYITDKTGLAFKLASCDSAMLWTKYPQRYKINNAGVLNSAYSDWGANYYGKSAMIFTSDRESDNGTDNRTGNSWFKLYQTGLVNKQTTQIVLDAGNSFDFQDGYHVGPITFNRTNDTAYITVTTDIKLKSLSPDKVKSQTRLYTRRLQLLKAILNKGQWTVASGFAYNNVKQYSVGNAALSPDGKLIYFSSDMPGGEGKTDIWYCEKQADGTWGKPINCGKVINTKEEDSFPYFDHTGTLYYASKGLPGMGGYDVYSAKGERANWGIPQNLKYPVNTTSDDFYLATHNGLNGYISSNRDGGLGSDDIYTFNRLPDTIPVKPIIAEVPKPVEPKYYVIKTIYYDLDKSFIRPDAAEELTKLAVILNEDSSLKVELSSYTDSRASYSYNMALSQRRAKAAVQFLVSKGISLFRLTANGYGKTHLVNQCADNVNCSEADHQLNRRTEFKLIKSTN